MASRSIPIFECLGWNRDDQSKENAAEKSFGRWSRAIRVCGTNTLNQMDVEMVASQAFLRLASEDALWIQRPMLNHYDFEN